MAESAQIKSVSKPWHEAIAEFFILYPEKSLRECADHFGVTLSWLSVVKNSDAFQDYYQARRREHFNDMSAALAETKIEDKLRAVADMSLDAIAKKIEDHTKEVPTKELTIDALQTSAALALKALGFGARSPAPGGPALVQNNTLIVSADAFRKAQGNLRIVREHIIDPALSAVREPAERILNGSTETIEHDPSKPVAVPAAA